MKLHLCVRQCAELYICECIYVNVRFCEVLLNLGTVSGRLLECEGECDSICVCVCNSLCPSVCKRMVVCVCLCGHVYKC